MNKLSGYKLLADERKLPLIKMIGKKPIEKEWQKIGYRPFGAIGFNRNHNAGILTGDTSMIITLDIDDPFLFYQTGYEVPDTFTVKPSKGAHHYFKLPASGNYCSKAFKKRGFDIRANGGCIVAPYSTHPDTGDKYTIINDVAMAPAPDWLLDLSIKNEGNNALSISTCALFPSIQSDLRATDELIEKYESELNKSAPKGSRSDQIWMVLWELIEDDLNNGEIIALFEHFSEGIGKKYYEKGGARVSWLIGQVEKVREQLEESIAEPFLASNKSWVNQLHTDLINTLVGSYNLAISREHSEALKSVCDLLIALLNNENSDWYSIPLGVGAGKTETIKHLIKFLYQFDKEQEFSLALSVEKISEIEEIRQWLLKHEIPETFFQVVHHKIEDLDDVFKKLPQIPVVIHTHYKLRGNSYLTEYFKYKGKDRNLLIFDESMVSSLTFADLTSSVSGKLEDFCRKYRVSNDLKSKVPHDLYLYIDTIKNLIEAEEILINRGDKRQAEIDLPADFLEGYELPELISVSNVIQTAMRSDENVEIIRDLLLLGKTPIELRQILLKKEEQGSVLFTMKEQISDKIRNLVTTDASREIRSLFRFSEKKVKKLDIETFQKYETLEINAIELAGGRTVIEERFKGDGLNPYLLMLKDIITEEEKTGKKDYLIFHSKKLKEIDSKINLYLLKEGILETEDLERISFETFGRENATNKYQDCEVIIFLGLHYKPKYAIKSLLHGETRDMDLVLNWKENEVLTGEILMQLHQGSGRGTMRRGDKQRVYYCAYNPKVFFRGLQRAFPDSSINLVDLPSLEAWRTAEKKNKEADKSLNRAEYFKKVCRNNRIPKETTEIFLGRFIVQLDTPKKFLEKEGLL